MTTPLPSKSPASHEIGAPGVRCASRGRRTQRAMCEKNSHDSPWSQWSRSSSADDPSVVALSQRCGCAPPESARAAQWRAAQSKRASFMCASMTVSAPSWCHVATARCSGHGGASTARGAHRAPRVIRRPLRNRTAHTRSSAHKAAAGCAAEQFVHSHVRGLTSQMPPPASTATWVLSAAAASTARGTSPRGPAHMSRAAPSASSPTTASA